MRYVVKGKLGVVRPDLLVAWTTLDVGETCRALSLHNGSRVIQIQVFECWFWITLIIISTGKCPLLRYFLLLGVLMHILAGMKAGKHPCKLVICHYWNNVAQLFLPQPAGASGTRWGRLVRSSIFYHWTIPDNLLWTT